MAESDFVFESGEPIDVGSPVENDYVEEGGELVSDGDVSGFVFISGRGLGRGFVSDGVLTIYEGTSTSDPILTEISFDITEDAPGPGTSVSIGFHSSNGSPEYDNVRHDDGIVIEDFDDCKNVTDYFDSGDLNDWGIGGGSGDCYLVETGFSTTDKIHSSLNYGLQSYPNWGKTLLFDINVDSGRDFGIYLGGSSISDTKFELTYNESNEEFRIRGPWLENKTVNFNSSSVPLGKQLWEIKFN